MDSIYGLIYEKNEIITSQIITPSDSTFNSKGLPAKIIEYNPFGEQISTKTITYYPSDTIYKIDTELENQRMETKNDELGNPIYFSTQVDQEKTEETYLENEYDSLNRLIVCHEYDSNRELSNIKLITYNDINEVTKYEFLNANYELEEYLIFIDGEKSNRLINYIEQFNAQGQLISAVKDIQFTWNARPVKSSVIYSYTQEGEPNRITVRNVNNSLIDNDYYEVIYKTKQIGVLFSFSTYEGYLVTSYIHKNDELRTHPLAKEFRFVMRVNAENKNKDN
jgi:hypothetical protein